MRHVGLELFNILTDLTSGDKTKPINDGEKHNAPDCR